MHKLHILQFIQGIWIFALNKFLRIQFNLLHAPIYHIHKEFIDINYTMEAYNSTSRDNNAFWYSYARRSILHTTSKASKVNSS